jgi:hypothetical protein
MLSVLSGNGVASILPFIKPKDGSFDDEMTRTASGGEFATFGNGGQCVAGRQRGVGIRQVMLEISTFVGGCPSWIHIELCALPRSLHFGVFWRRSGLGPEFASER